MALEDYQIALKVNAPNIDVSKPLLAAAEYNQRQAQTRDTHASATRKEYDIGSEEISRTAKSVLMEPEGPRRTEAWNAGVQKLHSQGYLSDTQFKQYYGNPSTLVLNQAVALGMPAATHSGISGETARNEAAGRYPYEVRGVSPTEDLVRPSQAPGAPQPRGLPFGGGAAPLGGAAPQQGVMPLPGGGQQISGPGTAPAPQRGVQANTPQVAAAVADYNDPVMKEIPKMEVKTPVRRPGVAIPAKTDPVQIARDEIAAKNYQTDIVDPANAATKQRAGLGSLRESLSNVETSRLGPVRSEASAWMYAFGMKPDKIQELTGVNPTSKEVFDKQSTQDAMKFVKDTIGAGEAASAIRVIQSSFPSTMNTEEANRILVDTMDAAAKWSEDKAKYAGAWVRKNDDVPMSERMDGFNRWWKDNYPLSRYTSEVYPISPPVSANGLDAGKLEKNTVYRMPDGSSLLYKGDKKFVPVPARPGQ